MNNTEPCILRELGDGLIMRRATPADADALAAFNAQVFFDTDRQMPNLRLGAWAADLVRGDHPTVPPDDVVLVENASGAIVSSMNWLSQRWSYDGIPFNVGRPELVGTHTEYRRRGLVRAQLDVLHGWSAARDELMQVITGIPYYYRQFGYEMALEWGAGRGGYKALVPPLKPGASEPVTIRPASEADLPLIDQTYRVGMQRYAVVCERDVAMWRYEAFGRTMPSQLKLAFAIIEADGAAVGFLAHDVLLRNGALSVYCLELAPGVSWLAVGPSVLRYLQRTGESYAAKGEEWGAYGLWLGTAHPIYGALDSKLPRIHSSYAWYVRVPDLPRLVQQIAPALEARLARSIAAGHSADLRLNFYRGGLRLVLEHGKITGVEPWRGPHPEDGSAGFPDLTFLQLVFGYRSLADLRAAWADCWVDGDEPRVLLDALFPRGPSFAWPIG